MISLLIYLLVLLVVVYVGNLIIAELGLPENIKKIAYVIFAVIVLLMLLQHLGYII